MSQSIIYVGLEVDDNAFHACLINETNGEVLDFSCRPQAAALVKKLKQYQSERCSLKICYEATYLGFSLCRELRDSGLDCQVIAPSLVPEMAGSTVKTDKKDCKKLARYFMAGLLTKVHVPDEQEEAVRDLIRSRSFTKQHATETRHHILSLCRRMGIHYRRVAGKGGATYWSKEHKLWLEKEINQHPDPVFKFNIITLLRSIQQLEELVALYDHQIDQLSQNERYQKRVKALICYRGIQNLTAMTLITELGDIRRFSHPMKLTSYIGFDVREYSSGKNTNRFGISNMGNAYLRTAICEITQSCNLPPKTSKPLRQRRNGIEPHLVQIADRAMHRLYKKSTRLLVAGKHRNKVKVACGRELLGFVWESLRAVA